MPVNMGAMATNHATSIHQPVHPPISKTLRNPPIPSAPLPQMSRPSMIRNPAPQVLNIPKVPTPPVLIGHHPMSTQSYQPVHPAVNVQSFHLPISPRCRSPAQQPPPAHSPINIESMSFALSGQVVDMTKHIAGPRLSARDQRNRVWTYLNTPAMETA